MEFSFGASGRTGMVFKVVFRFSAGKSTFEAL
jgi:hypothetical protein